jgi:hypothetical protein
MLLSERSASEIAFDEIEASCKLEEYRLTIYREITSVKLVMLQAASVEWTRRLDNTMVEQMVLLDRIDNLTERLSQVEDKLEK